MAKRLVVLLGMLAMMMGTALPALAESEPRLTGVISRPEATTYMYGTHAMTDEVGGEPYALESEVVDLDAYVGQRVTFFGASVPEYENGRVEGGPPLFEVTRVEPTDEGQPGPGIVAATGVLGEPYTPGQDPTPVYDLTDEATGTTYTLFDVGAGLDAFVGQRATVEGRALPA